MNEAECYHLEILKIRVLTMKRFLMDSFCIFIEVQKFNFDFADLQQSQFT